jgi:hypothetical protein
MTVKWSAFASGTTIAGTDTVVGLQGGANVDWTWSQAATFMWASPTLVTPALGVATATSVTASGLLQAGTTLAINTDALLSRPAAATWQLGAADAAAPVAQTLQVQNVVAGTSNTVGTDWTHKGSIGTGTGAGGKQIFQTAPAGTTGTAQNALATALTLTAPAVSQQPSVVVGNQAVATNATDGFLYIPTSAGTPTGTPTTFTGRVALCYDTTNHQFWIYDGGWKQPKTPAGAALVTWQ